MSDREVVILSGVRTPIGDYGGSLKDIPPTELAARVVREAMARSKAAPADIGQCVFGNVIHTEAKDMYLSRVAAVNGGLPVETGALTLNRLCGSGLQAIVSASQYILLGDVDAAVAGGAESMSRAAYANVTQRWGARMGDAKDLDMMVGALTDPFDTIHMGVTAENVAAKCGLSRSDQDAFAVESHKRAAAATTAGHFKSQVLPIELKSKKGPVQFDADEHVRADASPEGMSKLKAIFIKENGTVTAGNASGINDGAAAVILASAQAAQRHGLTPRARVLGMASAAVPPRVMGIGPVPSTRKLMARLGLKIGDFDLIEINEAFASQGLACLRQLGVADDADHVNPHGGAIALGHPLGMSGARIALTAVHGLEKRGGRLALATMCVGVGQGVSLALERV
jgi:acetyl-CoA C-acetyltransferase